MIQQNYATQLSPDRKNGHKSEPVILSEPTSAPTGIFEQSGGLLGSSDNSYATRLSNLPIHTAQRQLMAKQIGHMHGNRQLQRMIRPAAQNQKIPTNGHNRPRKEETQTIQREVNPDRIESVDKVLAKIKNIVSTTGKDKEPAEANLARFVKLIKPGIGFNPGATKDEADNMFVYTCRGGWIDLGHFFISAAAAYGIGYQQRRLEVRVGGTPYSLNDLLAKATNKLTPLLELLLKTVPDGVQGKKVLSDVQKLLASGEPKDTALVLGYWMEFTQQVAKLISDPGRSLPDPVKEQLKGALDEYGKLLKSVAPQKIQETIEGSARSAFTIEDLPSDCYGSSLGQEVWKQVDGAKMDSSPIYGLAQKFFSESVPVFPEPGSKTRCEMMNETTPGSCSQEEGKDVVRSGQGEPNRYGSTKPRLLNSAKSLCKDASPLPCNVGTSAGSPLPAAVLDLSDKGATVTVPEDIRVHQPRERGNFGGGVSIPGRPEQIDTQSPWVLSGPSFLRLTPKGNLIAYTTLSGVQGLGDIEASAQLGLGSGRFSAQAKGPLQVDVSGKVNIDFERLFQGLAGPELDQLKEVFKSEAFTNLVQKFVRGDLSSKEFIKAVKALVKGQFPQGLKGVIDTVLFRLESMEPVALATSLDAHGTVSVGGIPISGFLLHKSLGERPLLGLEAGVVTSELAKERVIVGAKGWLYGERFLQSQLTAGVDLTKQVGVADLHVESKYFGPKLSLDVRYQVSPAGDQEFLILGGVSIKHNWAGSKPKGTK